MEAISYKRMGVCETIYCSSFCYVVGSSVAADASVSDEFKVHYIDFI